jgi:hypothetical protein
MSERLKQRLHDRSRLGLLDPACSRPYQPNGCPTASFTASSNHVIVELDAIE